MENHQASEDGPVNRKRRLLWLASWYPNESDPYIGDFIKRQAEAVSIYQALHIVYVGKYSSNFHEGSANIKITEINKTNLQENLLYYSDKGNNRFITKIRSLTSYFRKHREYIRQLQKRNEMPDLVHVHIAMKAGLIALYLKWRFKIPYVLTEHWSGYYQQSKDSLFKKSLIERYLTKLVLKNATLLLPVSDALGLQINEFWMKMPYEKIPNVVNTRLFYPAKVNTSKSFRFIHVSTLLHPKNPEGIISAFNTISKQEPEVELVIVGPLNASLSKYISRENMSSGKIILTGEVSYEQVSIEMRKADALVIFSDYENMPCVMLEALCTGIPVIATNVGGISEVLTEDNGILVRPGDKTALEKAMLHMMRSHSLFDKFKISSQASEQFSCEKIGMKIKEVYDSVLEKKN